MYSFGALLFPVTLAVLSSFSSSSSPPASPAPPAPLPILAVIVFATELEQMRPAL